MQNCDQTSQHVSLTKKQTGSKQLNIIIHILSIVVIVQSLSCIQLFLTPCTAARQASMSFTISWSLLRLMSIESVMPSNHLILCRSLLLLSSIFPEFRVFPIILSSIIPFSNLLFFLVSVFSNKSAFPIRWPKYGNFSFSISPSNDYSGLISFRIFWFDLAVQGTLKSLLQQHNSKASILWGSTFFIFQL